MSKSSLSFSSAIRTQIVRMAIFITVIAACFVTAIGAYVAGIVLLAVESHSRWGWFGVAATVLVCLAGTSLIAAGVCLLLRRRWQRSPVDALSGALADPEADDASPESDEHASRHSRGFLSELLGGTAPSGAVVSAAAIIGAVVAVVGPFRLLRWSLRIAAVVRTARSLIGAATAQMAVAHSRPGTAGSTHPNNER